MGMKDISKGCINKTWWTIYSKGGEREDCWVRKKGGKMIIWFLT